MSPIVEGMIAEISYAQSVRREDVEHLRAYFGGDGVVDPGVAAALIGLDRSSLWTHPTWRTFLADAVADYIVVHAAPEGYVSAANASWLSQCLAPGGRMQTRTMFEVLMRVFETARWTPVSLARLALSQVYAAVAEGTGPLAAGRTVPPGQIAPEEVETIRRILYLFACERLPAVTRPEAEVLFAIDAALSHPESSPDWTEFMASVLVSMARSASGWALPSREVSLAPSSFRGRAAASSILPALDPALRYVRLSPEERVLARLERQRIEIVTGEELPAADIDWLAARLETSLAWRPAFIAAAARLACDDAPLDPQLSSAFHISLPPPASAAA